jgi:hypothetical protein
LRAGQIIEQAPIGDRRPSQKCFENGSIIPGGGGINSPMGRRQGQGQRQGSPDPSHQTQDQAANQAEGPWGHQQLSIHGAPAG